MSMNEIFIASKSPSLSNYLFLILDEICPGKLSLAPKFSQEIDLVIIDVETISPSEMAVYEGDIATLLFTHNLRPFLIQYTSRYDIHGILSLTMESAEILKTIEAALKQDIFYNEMMIGILFSNKANEIAEKVRSLTEREIEILEFMINDQTNEEIAQKLNLSVRTVNAHKGNIMRKIESKTTSGLIKVLLDYSGTFRKWL